MNLEPESHEEDDQGGVPFDPSTEATIHAFRSIENFARSREALKNISAVQKKLEELNRTPNAIAAMNATQEKLAEVAKQQGDLAKHVRVPELLRFSKQMSSLRAQEDDVMAGLAEANAERARRQAAVESAAIDTADAVIDLVEGMDAQQELLTKVVDVLGQLVDRADREATERKESEEANKRRHRMNTGLTIVGIAAAIVAAIAAVILL